MYSLTISDNDALTFKTQASLSDIMDKFLVAKRNGVDAVTLVNLHTRKVLRHVEREVQLPALKLTDAMRKALFADEAPLVGLPGAPNTLKALEARGLVKRDNVGVARLTSLGRQYRAQKKGA